MKTRVAIIGVGYMGWLHAVKYKRLDSVEVVAIVDTDRSRAAHVAEKLDCREFYTVDDLLSANLEIEAVSIATPTSEHAAITRRLLTKGIHCLVEKPLASSAAEAEELVSVATEQGVILLPGHLERFNPAVLAVRNRNPEIRYLKAYRVGPTSFRSIDIDVVMDIMIHDLDLIRFLLGSLGSRDSVEIVRAVSSPEGVNDIANVHLSYNGCHIDLTASRLAIARRSKIRMFTEDGYYSLDCDARRAMKLTREKYYAGLNTLQLEQAMGRKPSPDEIFAAVGAESIFTLGQTEGDDSLSAELKYFLTMISGMPSEEILRADDGVAAIRMAEDILRSQRRNHAIIPEESFR